LALRGDTQRPCHAAQECDEVAPSHVNCPSRTSLPKGSVVRHSKIAPPMTGSGQNLPSRSAPACLLPPNADIAKFAGRGAQEAKKSMAMR
jgi:hypothetical protein